MRGEKVLERLQVCGDEILRAWQRYRISGACSEMRLMQRFVAGGHRSMLDVFAQSAND
jgi:hypothetical protein